MLCTVRETLVLLSIVVLQILGNFAKCRSTSVIYDNSAHLDLKSVYACSFSEEDVVACPRRQNIYRLQIHMTCRFQKQPTTTILVFISKRQNKTNRTNKCKHISYLYSINVLKNKIIRVLINIIKKSPPTYATRLD